MAAPSAGTGGESKFTQWNRLGKFLNSLTIEYTGATPGDKEAAPAGADKAVPVAVMAAPSAGTSG